MVVSLLPYSPAKCTGKTFSKFNKAYTKLTVKTYLTFPYRLINCFCQTIIVAGVAVTELLVKNTPPKSVTSTTDIVKMKSLVGTFCVISFLMMRNEANEPVYKHNYEQIE